MKFFSALPLALGLLPSFIANALAANSWAGANNYYIYTLPVSEQQRIFQAMSDSGMKVLRTWVTGLGSGQKGSDNSQIGDLEHDGLGHYDPAVLNLIDETMVVAHQYGVKLLIAMHDINALKGGDAYAKAAGSIDNFYTDETTIDAFNKRITYILSTHKNAKLGNQSWSELGDYIFGFEPQNEPMIFDQSFYASHLSWICNAAAQIRENVSNKNMLIFTGGGSGSRSVQDTFFGSSCTGIDVVAIHDYNDDFGNFLPGAIKKAQAAGKKLIVEEWGSSYNSNDGSRVANLKSNAQAMNSYGVPWLYWQLISNNDPHSQEDFEIDVYGQDWSTLESLAKSATNSSGAFDFSASLTSSS